MSEILFSGIRPTGNVHIGNYLGAVKNWVALQDKYTSYFCIVDYHAIISAYEPAEMPGKIKNMAASLLACGIDPEKATLFVQSDVPEHTELNWILGSVTSFNWLTGMIQFKEKSDHQADNVNAGLFCYPVLQTADIALYKSLHVPVGEDQVQHIELARDIIRKFNSLYGEILIEPKALITEAKRVMGTDGINKMSKSLNNYLAVTDSAEEIFNKLRPAVTDTARMRRTDPGTPEKCNVYLSYHKNFSDQETLNEVQEGCTSARIGCIDCKKMLFRNMEKELLPIREKYQELINRKGYIEEVLAEGAAKAGAVAKETIKTVKSSLGLKL